jgi:transketolase
MPGLTIIRPGDANETSYAWKVALDNSNGPTLLVLTRQNLPTLQRTEANPAKLVQKGAYIFKDSKGEIPDAILIGSGSELQYAVEARELLFKQGVDARVVSMPSWELFEKQGQDYKSSVFPQGVKNRVAIEAGTSFGWERYVGDNGSIIGVNSFGESGPYEDLFEHFGITAEAVVKVAIK